MFTNFVRNRMWRWVFALAIMGGFCSGCFFEGHHHDDWHEHHDDFHDHDHDHY